MRKSLKYNEIKFFTFAHGSGILLIMNSETEKSMNVNDVLAFIMVNASRDDLNKIASAHRFRSDALRSACKAQFTRGDTVTWTNSRNGQRMTGTVVKFNRKTIDVRTAQGLWRVSAQLLNRG